MTNDPKLPDHQSEPVVIRVSLMVEMFLVIQRAKAEDLFDGERFNRCVFPKLTLIEKAAVVLALRGFVQQGVMSERRCKFFLTSTGESYLRKWD